MDKKTLDKLKKETPEERQARVKKLLEMIKKMDERLGFSTKKSNGQSEQTIVIFQMTK